MSIRPSTKTCATSFAQATPTTPTGPSTGTVTIAAAAAPPLGRPGDGSPPARSRGSDNNDWFYAENGRVRTRSNKAGGTLGGISSGEEIVVRVAIKPTSSVAREQETIDTSMEPRTILVEGRHDPSVVPRAVPVAEAMLAIVLADLLLLNRAARI